MNKLKRGDRLIAYDGVKAVTILGDEGWTSLSTENIAANTADWFTARVPIIYRGMTIRANGVAAIPFDLINLRGDVVDSTDDWKNVVGFLPKPESLFWLLEAAWVVTGQAYLYQSKNSSRVVKILRPLAPGSVTWDKNQNLFVRGGTPQKTYPAAVSPDGVVSKDLESIVYLWQPDPSVEWGVPTKYPGLAALHAMGVLWNMDEAATNFFKRGMMKITAFVVPPGTQESDKQAFEEKVNQTLTGIKNFFRTIFLRAGQVQPVDLGGGLEGLANVPLTKEKREDVAIALGVPMSKLFTESAAGLGGGGVVQADDKRLILDTCLPEWLNIARILNQQVFEPLGYRLVERHEKMDEFQQSENERSSALSDLVGAFNVNPKLAMILAPEVGLELSEEAIKALDEMIAEKESEPEPEPVPVAQAVEDEAPEMEDEEAAKYAAELLKFQRKALKNIGKAVKFESDIIPAVVLLDIQTALPFCVDADEVKGLFGRHATGKASQTSQNDELALQIKRALDYLEAA